MFPCMSYSSEPLLCVLRYETSVLPLCVGLLKYQSKFKSNSHTFFCPLLTEKVATSLTKAEYTVVYNLILKMVLFLMETQI